MFNGMQCALGHVCIAALRTSSPRERPGRSGVGLGIWPRRGRRIMWKIATSAAAIGLSLCLATAADARGGGFGGGGGGGHVGGGGGGGGHVGGGGGGGHFGGGGGAMHFGGGGAHFGGGAMRMGGAHFTAHAAPHFNAGRINSGRISSRMATSHIGHPGRSAFQSAIHGQGAHGLNHVTNPAAVRTGLAGTHLAHANAAFAGRRSFAANRQFAGAGAFHPFWNHGWHWHNHLGWIGPLFWPYAYGDFFYYALWPDDYYDADPFWVYGYGDIFECIFSQYL